jgi:hypothetical protein
MHYSQKKNIGGLLLIIYKPIPTIECSVSEYFFDGCCRIGQILWGLEFFLQRKRKKKEKLSMVCRVKLESGDICKIRGLRGR